MADYGPGPTPEELRKGKLIGSRSAGGALVTAGDEELERFSRLNAQVYATYFTALELDNKYYHKKFGADILPREWKDDGFKAVIPPTGHLAVESASEHILSTPKIHRPPVPTTEGDMDANLAADKVQQFLKFWWHNAFINGDPLGVGKKKVVKDGRMVLKVEVRWDVIQPGALVYGKNEWIWRTKVCANETVMLDPDDPYDPSYAYEFYQMRVDEAKRLFPEAGGSWKTERRSPTDTVRYVEYYEKPSKDSKGKRIIWIDNERVLDEVNPYYYVCGVDESGKDTYDGWVPYACAPSGWGDVDSKNMPVDRYVGILRYMHDVLEAEAQTATAGIAQLRVSTFPPIKMWGGTTDKEKGFRFGPAAVMKFTGPKTDQDAEVMNLPGMPSGVSEILNRTHQWANELSRFNTLGGGAQRGVDTATEADLNVRNASSRLTGPVAGITGLVTRVNSMILKTNELVLEAPVVIYGASDAGPGVVVLNPEDIDGFYMTFVSLQTTEQAALDRALLKTWADAFNSFRLDPEYAMRQAGIENPTERIQKSLDYQVLIDPMLHQQRVAERLGPEGMATISQMNALLNGPDVSSTPPAPKGGPMGFVPPQNPLTGDAAEAQVVTDARQAAFDANPERQLQ